MPASSSATPTVRRSKAAAASVADEPLDYFSPPRFRTIIWIRDAFPILSERGACQQSYSRKGCSGTP